MFDGVFLRKIIQELNIITNKRINKLISLNDSEFILSLSSKLKILLSLKYNHLRLTNLEDTSTLKLSNFNSTLKKHLENSIIKNISQFENDRILILTYTSTDDLGYIKEENIVVEFFGRNSNIIICTNDFIIIDCFRREIANEDNLRTILPKYKYNFLKDFLNPFKEEYFENKNYLGLSSLIKRQIDLDKNFAVLESEVLPVLITNDQKSYFYCFDLKYLEGNRTYFNSLSDLLEFYYTKVLQNQSISKNKIIITNYIKKEISKNNLKISKLKNDLLISNDNLIYEKYGNLLKSNMHLVQKGMSKIIVNDFYEENCPEIEISLNNLSSPSENLQIFFTKYQKAKRSINIINEQIELTNQNLKYLKCLLNQVTNIKGVDEVEMLKELNLVRNEQKTKKTPNYISYKLDDGSLILIGKNNIQNNFITFTLAKPNDYFFHIENSPGSHLILKTNEITNSKIEICAILASIYSTFKNSTKTSVNYTQVRNLKKVPGMKGSFVTYTKYKTVIVKPDFELIKSYLIN